MPIRSHFCLLTSLLSLLTLNACVEEGDGDRSAEPRSPGCDGEVHDLTSPEVAVQIAAAADHQWTQHGPVVAAQKGRARISQVRFDVVPTVVGLYGGPPHNPPPYDPSDCPNTYEYTLTCEGLCTGLDCGAASGCEVDLIARSCTPLICEGTGCTGICNMTESLGYSPLCSFPPHS